MAQEPQDRTDLTSLLGSKGITSWAKNSGEVILKGDMSDALEFPRVQTTLQTGAKIVLSPTASVHCHFSVLLVLQIINPNGVSNWQIPDYDYFETYFPILWDEGLQASLPEEAKIWLAAQQDRLAMDWDHAKESLEANWPDIEETSTSPQEIFLRAWLYVESRAYKDTRGDTTLVAESLNQQRQLSGDTALSSATPKDRQVLFPVIDHLTLDPEGCKVHIGKGSYLLETKREYKPGQPIGLLCGNNKNDLLITCGATTQNHEPPEASSNENLRGVLNKTKP
ncbi:SET domain-containing protein [Fusarium coicis]|nr:SET domain-containing protein [Fusarium coicis]